jgi:hypothetical protein
MTAPGRTARPRTTPLPQVNGNQRPSPLRRPGFAWTDRLVSSLAAVNAKAAQDTGKEALKVAPAIVLRRSNEIFEMIQRAVPSGLPRFARDEVVSMMALAAVERKLKPSHIQRRVPEFVSAYYRQFSNYGPVSLDRPLFEESSMTLDTVTRGLWG